MTAETLFLLSGISLFLGGSLATLGWLLFMILDPTHQAYQNPRWLPLNTLIMTGGLFIALGLPGFYLHQASQAGVLGLIGFILFFIGIAIPYLAVHSIETAMMPNVPGIMMKFVSVGAPSLFLGLLITGIATWRADVYPPTLGIALILSDLFGLLTITPGVPAWLGRNLASVPATATFAWAGILMILL